MAVDNFMNTASGILSNNNINGLMKLNELGGAFQSGLKASKAGWGTMGAGVAQGIGSMFGKENNFSEEQKARQSAARNIAGMFGPWGQAFALADGAIAGLVEGTDSALTNFDENTAKTLGINTFWSDAMNSTGITSGIGALMGQRVNSFGIDDIVKSGESGYASTMNYLRALSNASNAKVLPKQAEDLNGKMDAGRTMANNIYNIMTTSTMRKDSDYNQNLQHQWQNRIAGQNYLGVTVGKNGTKLLSLEDARRIANLKKDPAKLQNGGEIPGIDTSILPEGQLHKNLNHLDELNPDLEDATKKGIPVMAVENGKIGEQTAEVEREEIVFRLDITKQLEELRKDGSEEAMIQAGILVANEVIENTTDNTGQITEEVKDGE